MGSSVGSSVGSSSEELLLLLSLIYVGAMVGDGVAFVLLAALDPKTMMDNIAISWQRRVSFTMVFVVVWICAWAMRISAAFFFRYSFLLRYCSRHLVSMFAGNCEIEFFVVF